MVLFFSTTFFFFATFLCLLYLWLISRYCYGWIKTKTVNTIFSKAIFVSIIIPVRNEEKNISDCLHSLSQQTYATTNFEIIVVDDFSSDETISKVQLFCKRSKNVKLISSTNSGKKNAITHAITIAKGELIITTDADCTMGRDWLSAIVSFYEKTLAQMIVAPVSFFDEKNAFEKMQSIEFMSLIASAGASLYFNEAILCNGANLIYTKKIFEEVNGFENIDTMASGDDVLLMYKVKEKYPQGIKFLKCKEAIVYTKAKATLNEFINQRKRWASKKFSILNRETKFVGSIVYFFNLSCLLLPFIAWYNCLQNPCFFIFLKLSWLVIGLKFLVDFIFLYVVSEYFDKRRFLIYFFPEQLFYIIYIVFIGIFGGFGKYEWKGREINN